MKRLVQPALHERGAARTGCNGNGLGSAMQDYRGRGGGIRLRKQFTKKHLPLEQKVLFLLS